MEFFFFAGLLVYYREVAPCRFSIALGVVRNKASKESLSSLACRRIFDACVKLGLLAMTYASGVPVRSAMTIGEIKDFRENRRRRLYRAFIAREGWWK